ncbi:Unconventional myosin-IXb [Acipenser ruthenus]|uniref:Unconventional myosin-IXb n=1 Tax=Acipenser ruthenus TaxID=7906 RepID=A0A662YLV1_ACIRT|nr:Unconventional myosin-IXb [Acipenser ruthenus]
MAVKIISFFDQAFGNAKTAYNNNSSRFGKFIQVNYLESGVVRGAVVEKYLLEKSRLVSREKNERNYHVFYYLLLGASEEERKEFKLLQPDDYIYLKQQAMEMVGFLPSTKKQIFSVLSAILYLGNVSYQKKSSGRDEGLEVGPPEVLNTLSELLKVREEMLVEALTKRKTVTVNEKLILPYSLNEAITARDSMAKSLYSALFDWIVLRINHALLNKKDMEESVTCLSIGVLDIFGFEDFETNSFEQFCINYANEQLQYYFNQHIFKLEQEEYQSEGISWHNIDYTDNVGCIHLISKKPTGLFHLLDEESNFPHATNKTLLAKFKQQHDGNQFFVGTPVMEPAFIIRHFAGKVKYQIKDFREKNTDYMRPDIVALLRSSDRAYIRELVGMDPVAVFRWAILRAAIRGIAAFCEAGRRWAAKTAGVVRRGSRVPLGELQRANTPVEKMYRDMHAQIIRSIKGLPWDGEDPRKLLQSWSRLQHPRDHFLKNKSTKQRQLIPKNLLDSKSLKHIVSRTLHDRTTKSLLHLHKKKKPPSISAQFQTSLSKLMETLGRAEPFFIRCIRSNSEKMELRFDDTLVLQQLRYTGMLETVRIRHSGYSAKYTFQEFVEQFRVLLPKNSRTSQEEISALFEKMGFNKNNYQIGKTKVFMKEAERQRLQDTLHKEVIRKIIFLQRWFRAQLERRHYLRMRQAATTIQKCWRSYNMRHKHSAATTIQALWRGYSQKMAYQKQLDGIRKLQAVVRGHAARRRPGFFRKILKKHDKRSNKDLHTPEEPEITFSQAVAECMQLNKVSEGPPQCPGDPSPKARKNTDIKISNAPPCSEQWHTSLQREITNTNELKELDEFLRNQVNDLRSRGKQLSDTENIFIMATMQFRENIKTMYSRQNQPANIRYRNLMKNYQLKVASLAGEKQKAEVQLVVNLFQSVLDGFIRAEIKKEEAEPAKSEKRMGHVLSSYQVNIIQSCDQCTSYIFAMEKALICSYCKIICHKKCISKIQNECTSYCVMKNETEAGSRHFGVRVCALTSERNPVPIVLEILLEHVEMNGLYTEGIYRKSGSANRMKELWQRLEADPTAVNLEEYPIHAVTGILKQWLRELPDPLMTFTYYNDFLHAVEMPGKQEQLQAIYRILEQLPQANYNTLERLVFHLVRVAKEEPHNRMTPNALAIVYAPCILRCPDNADPLTSMKDVAKTTMCVEMLINEQIRKYNERIEEIEQLEYAEALAVNQLKLKRQNTLWPLELRFSPYKRVVVNEKSSVDLSPVHEDSPTDSDIEAEKTLMERIKSIKEEKEEIVYRLPELEQPGSDQENLDSEASLSTESLLDERTGILDSEGPAKHLGKQKSHPVAKPPRSFLHNSRALLVQSNSSLPPPTVRSSSATLHGTKLPQRAPTMPTSNIKLLPGILTRTSSQTLPFRNAVILRLVKGREQPARRKDSIQSVYVVPGQDPFPAQPRPVDCHPSAAVCRRFSDPDVPYTD